MLTYIIITIFLVALLVSIFLLRAKKLKMISAALPKAVRKRVEEVAEKEETTKKPSQAPAILTTEPVQKKLSKDIAALLRKADTHFKRGEFEEAEKLLIQVLATEPKHLETHERLGKLYVLQGNLVKGEGAYRAVIALAPEQHGAYTGLGEALVKQEKFSEAVVAYEKACELKPDDVLGWNILSALFERMEHFERATQAMEAALQRDVTNMEFLLKLWELYQRTDAPSEKIKDVLRKILDIDPHHAEARERLNLLLHMDV